MYLVQSIYIKRLVSLSVCLSVCHVLFVPGGQTICLSPGDKHFYIERGQTLLLWVGGQIFFVGDGVAYDDVDEEMVVSKANIFVSEANIFVSEASKLSAGARIFRGP